MQRSIRFLSLLIAGALLCTALVSVAGAQNGAPRTVASAAQSLMRDMVGAWDVQQRMWPASGAKAIELAPAFARRRMVEGAFLEEVMAHAPGAGKEAFTRIAYFNYNAVSRQYEYFSLDSRAPQMMSETSREAWDPEIIGGVLLYGDNFVAPRWGKAKNVPFRYRLTIGEVKDDEQVVQLYLTPQTENGAREFLAFEYVYTRRRAVGAK